MNEKSASASARAMRMRSETFKQKWLARGMTEQEYERSQLLNELYHLAIETGRSEVDVTTEFRDRSAEELIEMYGRLLPTNSRFRSLLSPPASYAAEKPLGNRSGKNIVNTITLPFSPGRIAWAYVTRDKELQEPISSACPALTDDGWALQFIVAPAPERVHELHCYRLILKVEIPGDQVAGVRGSRLQFAFPHEETGHITWKNGEANQSERTVRFEHPISGATHSEEIGYTDIVPTTPEANITLLRLQSGVRITAYAERRSY